MFVDRVKINLKAGKGGDGIVAFLREKYVPLGGPSGGDGGNGGSIIFKVDTNKSTLLDLRYNKKIIAEDGGRGKIKKMHGANGENFIIRVPLGTTVKDLKTNKIIADLTNPDQEVIICHGGKGGLGNYHFMSGRNPAPEYAEMGEFGEEKDVLVELKLLADCGLVGFPSVGKSTLLSVVSSAKPEIADYPFTTLIPNLGVVKVKDGRSFVMADLPGLIEGASLGKGLGYEFLRHIERCRVIVHVIDMGAEDNRDPVNDYQVINNELASYQYRLLERPQIVIANKMDLDNAKANLERFKKAYPDIKVFETITLINEGLEEALYEIADLIDKTPIFPIIEEENEGVIYSFNEEDKEIHVTNLGNGKWRLSGSRIERLIQKSRIESDDDILRLATTMRKMGVDQLLREKGALDGDEIYILDFCFEFSENYEI